MTPPAFKALNPSFIAGGLIEAALPNLDSNTHLGDYLTALLIKSSGGAGPVKLRQPGSS